MREFLAQNLLEIEQRSLAVFFVDECHLLWGDVCGYVWGKKSIRLVVPIQNQRERQTYFGGLNYQTQEFIIGKYSAGNCENTVLIYQGSTITMSWSKNCCDLGWS